MKKKINNKKQVVLSGTDHDEREADLLTMDKSELPQSLELDNNQLLSMVNQLNYKLDAERKRNRIMFQFVNQLYDTCKRGYKEQEALYKVSKDAGWEITRHLDALEYLLGRDAYENVYWAERLKDAEPTEVVCHWTDAESSEEVEAESAVPISTKDWSDVDNLASDIINLAREVSAIHDGDPYPYNDTDECFNLLLKSAYDLYDKVWEINDKIDEKN